MQASIFRQMGSVIKTFVDTTKTELQTSIQQKVNLDQLGIAGGVATLDSSGKVPSSQLPILTPKNNVITIQASAIDCSLGSYFIKTISTDTSFTFTNVPNAGEAYSFVLEITHKAGVVVWPASVKWPRELAPTLTAGKTHMFVFVTDDGGARWRAAANLDYVN